METARLRNTLKKLREVPFDRTDFSNVATAPQEMLDFLAMLSGLKPVYLLGRGFNDPDWIGGVLAIAEKLNLRIIDGPEWELAQASKDRPDWYLESKAGAPGKDRQVFYICKAKSIADRVQKHCESGAVTIEDEADLLGYPRCCVTQHHATQSVCDQMFFTLVERHGAGDVEKMKKIVRDDVKMTPETPGELAMAEKLTKPLLPAPFTSFAMCDTCAKSASSPAARISERYVGLVDAIDSKLKSEIDHYQSALGQ